jgi:hypothetical protein
LKHHDGQIGAGKNIRGGEMKTKINNILLLLILAGVGTSWGLAQDTADKSKSKAEIRTITGCLSKGSNPKEFKLAGNDGSAWKVRSRRVALADHVGHTITVTGVETHAKLHNLKEDAKDAAKDSGIKKSSSEHGHLIVTEVKMVSDSCQK